MPLNLRGTAAAILSLVTVSGAETAFAQKPGGILMIAQYPDRTQWKKDLDEFDGDIAALGN